MNRTPLDSGRGMTRRRALRLGLGAVTALTFPAIGAGIGSNFAPGKTVKPRPFELPFAVPLVLALTSTDAMTDYYEMTQMIDGVGLLPGLQTWVWGCNGTSPGPTIRARTNRRTVVRQINALPEAVSVHLHGGIQAPGVGRLSDRPDPPRRHQGVRLPQPPPRSHALLPRPRHGPDRAHVYKGLSGLT